MRKNVGGYERIARIVVGAALTYLALSRWHGRARGKLAMSVGGTLLSTGLGQSCPGNTILGRNSYRSADGEGDEVMGDLPA